MALFGGGDTGNWLIFFQLAGTNQINQCRVYSYITIDYARAVQVWVGQFWERSENHFLRLSNGIKSTSKVNVKIRKDILKN